MAETKQKDAVEIELRINARPETVFSTLQTLRGYFSGRDSRPSWTLVPGEYTG
jgi:hypothetical protein